MITTTTLPTPWAVLEASLRARRPVRVCYHGRQRVICVHALGWTNARPMVLGYQTGGETSTATLPTDPPKRWRCMYVDEIDDIVIADPGSRWGSADNYDPSQPFAGFDSVVITATPASAR